MAPLQEGTLVEAIMAVRGQIDFLWQFFVTVHIALFALLFIYDHAVENLNAIAKFFAVLGVAAFEWINGNALAHTYLLLDAMQDQFRWNYGQADRFHPAFYEQFVLASYATRPATVLLTHSSALLVVLLAFASRRFIQTRTLPPRL
ncbi:MAG TPA: hypothetical protein VN623_12085 [Hyphomicrobium sp.]|jgi:hypothetical protein|uniref:hypothetical protein n=1 Tax=Hyphomicrobium sp. TaxID=82 RepID=UPI002C16AC4A|nr:hypothetical protein [Hyphomicrobium sp.]HXE02676.1 hypothetical protein [Hyphomicrobium sp.]